MSFQFNRVDAEGDRQQKRKKSKQLAIDNEKVKELLADVECDCIKHDCVSNIDSEFIQFYSVNVSDTHKQPLTWEHLHSLALWTFEFVIDNILSSFSTFHSFFHSESSVCLVCGVSVSRCRKHLSSNFMQTHDTYVNKHIHTRRRHITFITRRARNKYKEQKRTNWVR